MDVTERCAAETIETMENVAETGSKEKSAAVHSRHVLENVSLNPQTG